MKQLLVASGGNINDKYIASFGLYVDFIEVDKRIRELIRQISGNNSWLKGLASKIIKKKTNGDLVKELVKINKR